MGGTQARRTRKPKPSTDEPVACPFQIVIDSREKRPFSFDGLRANADLGHRPISVEKVVTGIPSGDYTVRMMVDLGGLVVPVDWSHRIAVERKSLADLFGTILDDRDRFEKELARLDQLQFAAVVVEGQLSDVLSYITPGPVKTPHDVRATRVDRSILAWQQRFPRVHWRFEPGRARAEEVTFRILERAYRNWSAAVAASRED